MSSLLDDIDVTTNESNNVVYYDVSKDQDIRLIVGEFYPFHVIEVVSKDVNVKSKYKATVYNLRLEIAPECKDFTYTRNGETFDGSPYVGRTIRANGVFKFLEPGLADKFKANHGGNGGYLELCEILNVECPTQTVTTDSGETKELRALPNITDDDILGKPILGKLGTKGWRDRDGNERTSLIVKNLEKWSEGKVVQVDGLPV